MTECPFCNPTQIRSTITYHGWGGYMLMVFEPLAPVTPGHVLVVPTLHAPHAAADPALAAAAMAVAAQVAALHPAANIITSIGHEATQTVPHMHLHVVPRRPGDALPLPWTPQQEHRHVNDPS